MSHAQTLKGLIRNDPWRWQALVALKELRLPDGWIGAGFVRNAVWNHLHGRPSSDRTDDVDVVWFDAACTDQAEDRRLEAVLHGTFPPVPWSVKNQARMHVRNHDAPYASVADALCHWPETATAVAVRLKADDSVEVLAPCGLDDLFGLIVRPTLPFGVARRPIFHQRIEAKQWLEKWPKLRIAHDTTVPDNEAQPF